MVKLSMRISISEARLLEAIKDLRYGEIYGIEILSGGPEEDISVTPAQKALIEAIEDGLRKIDILTVHNGEPVMAEVDLQRDGFRCRKKVKFPTV